MTRSCRLLRTAFLASLPVLILPSLILVSLILVSRTTVAFSQDQTLVQIAAPPQPGRLQTLDSQTLTLEANGQKIQVPLDQVVRWGVQKDPGKGPQIVLTDGSVVIADILELERHSLKLGLDLDNFGNPPLWNDVSVPLKYVRGLLLRPPADPFERDRLLHTIQSASGNSDRILLENGDVLEGTLIPAPANVDEGQREPGADEIWLRMNGREVSVPRAKATGLIFNPTLAEPVTRTGDEATHATFGFQDGSFVHASRWEIQDDLAHLHHGSGVVFATDAQTFIDQLAFFRPANPRVRYLSEVKPLDYRHVPFLERPWPYEVDGSVVGGRLRFDGDIYPKGLGMHSASRLVFPLRAGDKQFLAEVALDDQAQERGSVVFEVLLLKADGWQRAGESALLRGSTPEVQTLTVDVSEARAILLAVRYADYGDLRDYANWLEPRIYR